MRMRCNYFLITAEICHIWTASYLWEYPRAFCIFLDVHKKWSPGICHDRCDMENGGVEGLSLNEGLRSRACRMYPVWWCNRAGKRYLPAYILVCSPVALTTCPRPHPSHLSVFTPEIFISRAPPWLISLSVLLLAGQCFISFLYPFLHSCLCLATSSRKYPKWHKKQMCPHRFCYMLAMEKA